MSFKDLIEYKDLFIQFFIPGFIFFRIFTLLLPVKTHDISKSIIEIMTYGTLSYVSYLFLTSKNFIEKSIVWDICFILIFPIVVALIISYILKLDYVRENVYDISPTSWDFKFLYQRDVYILVTFKDNKMIGGYFGRKSVASQYPKPKEIFLEEEWLVDEEDERFICKILDTDGIWINCNEIKSLKFFNNNKN